MHLFFLSPPKLWKLRQAVIKLTSGSNLRRDARRAQEVRAVITASRRILSTGDELMRVYRSCRFTCFTAREHNNEQQLIYCCSSVVVPASEAALISDCFCRPRSRNEARLLFHGVVVFPAGFPLHDLILAAGDSRRVIECTVTL